VIVSRPEVVPKVLGVKPNVHLLSAVIVNSTKSVHILLETKSNACITVPV
jgi:hypothetical protein